MAEAVLSALIAVLLKTMASPLLEKFGSICGIKKELNKLSSNFTAIQAVLEDAEEQQQTSNSIRNWLDKLKDVAYDVEDVLDEFSTEDLRRKVENRDRMMNKVPNFFTPWKSIAFKLKMSKKVKHVAKRLDEIAQERFIYTLRQENVDRQKETRAARIPTHSFVHESEVHGRKEDKEKLVQLLIRDEDDVSVIPIVGMGGLGKTTLAQYIYNDERVKSNFKQRMRVFVSEKFDPTDIIKAMIEFAKLERCDLEHMVRCNLALKKYLLVLDDVWNETQEAWLRLKTLLKVGARGSKIIATTCSDTVANIMRTCPRYHLKGLLSGYCWSLFRERAFPMKDEETYPKLVSIGKEIVNKCQGVPLAAKALGGLLLADKSESKWVSIRDNEIWKLKEDQIMSTLKLSYNHLPSRLKQCFTYISLFPKGHSFEQGRVLKMWIAQGFIQPSEEGEEMEDTGREHFDELCWRSFFQEIYLDYAPGHIKERLFKMLDLIYELARSVGGNEYLIFEDTRKCVPRKTKHLSVLLEENADRMDLKRFHNAEKLRTLIQGNLTFFMQPDAISGLKYLRVLDLSYNPISTLPNSIGKLKHLRYLDLSWTRIKTLSESICNLWNLQTLRFFGCRYLRELPNNMRKMISLRHIEGIEHCMYN